MELELKLEQEYALCLLGAILQGTDTELKQFWKDENISPEKGEEEVIKLLYTINNENLFFEKSSFFFSLRIRLCRELMADKDNFERNFTERLKKIFPEKLAERLALHTFDKAREILISGEQVYPSKQEIEDYKKRSYEIVQRYENYKSYERYILLSDFPHSNLPHSKGIATQIVKCPQCGTPKRIDAKTKTFRCKCGLKKPYPFTESVLK